ncbi:MAG: YkgJ family cysteine cluster protein [Proteobacteria bacterium]|nr:YkgJ family cysteine cluster protein [Pseudomonadota bacterium]
MIPEYSPIPDRARPFLDELENLYREMDRQYYIASTHYAFDCSGCEDNCCLTRFYHHTLAEFLYLTSAFLKLPPETADEIIKKARLAVQTYEKDAPPQRIMCPLNTDGRCVLYNHRPMICRMHGIPNEMRRPDGITLRGPGCPEFNRRHGKKEYYTFDRTPFYIKMATIEKNLKTALQLSLKFKKTIAEMIVSIRDGE